MQRKHSKWTPSLGVHFKEKLKVEQSKIFSFFKLSGFQFLQKATVQSEAFMVVIDVGTSFGNPLQRTFLFEHMILCC